MDTYKSYLQQYAGNVLAFEEALQIYNDMAEWGFTCFTAYISGLNNR